MNILKEKNSDAVCLVRSRLDISGKASLKPSGKPNSGEFQHMNMQMSIIKSDKCMVFWFIKSQVATSYPLECIRAKKNPMN